jgi:hypothetical protein
MIFLRLMTDEALFKYYVGRKFAVFLSDGPRNEHYVFNSISLHEKCIYWE